MNLLERRRAMMVQGGGGSILPSGYTQLDYIENTSNAFIFLPPISSGTKIETYFAPDLNNIPRTYGCICGVDSNLQIAFLPAGKANVGNATSLNVFYTNGVKAKVNATFDASSSNSAYIVNDVNTNLHRAYTSTYKFAVFGASSNNTSATYIARGKMYSFKMWNSSDVLIHDLIPCTDPNNIYGMYDIVGEIFYSSENSDTFSGG